MVARAATTQVAVVFARDVLSRIKDVTMPHQASNKKSFSSLLGRAYPPFGRQSTRKGHLLVAIWY
jgi:hypothetical protein